MARFDIIYTIFNPFWVRKIYLIYKVFIVVGTKNSGAWRPMERDLGVKEKLGVHLRSNLKEIISVEALIEREGWLEEPEEERIVFENMDGGANLTAEMTEFWFHCGQNRDNGIKSILNNEKVTFNDVLATDQESESENFTLDLKSMIEKLPQLISDIPQTNQTKTFITELYEYEIVQSDNFNRVSEFYTLVNEIVNGADDISEEGPDSDIESDQD